MKPGNGSTHFEAAAISVLDRAAEIDGRAEVDRPTRTHFVFVFPVLLTFVAGCGVTKEFHQSYPFAPDGRVILEAATGGATIRGWNRDEVRVSVIASAPSGEKLRQTRIRVEPGPESIRLWSEETTLEGEETIEDAGPGPATVHYILDVPQSAVLEKIDIYAGGLEIAGVRGSITARVGAGSIHTDFDAMGQSPASIVLETLDGGITVRLPRRADVRIDAQAWGGNIRSDIGIPMRNTLPNGDLVSELREVVGEGRSRLRMTAKGGDITLREIPGR